MRYASQFSITKIALHCDIPTICNSTEWDTLKIMNDKIVLHRTEYVMLGIKLPYKELAEDISEFELFGTIYEDNAYEKEIRQHMGLTMISDDLNKQYIFFGIVLAKGLQDRKMPITDIDEKLDYTNRKLVRKRIEVALGITAPLLKIWAFSHIH